MVWHCIEERTADPIGQIVRKLIFTEIYENEHYARGKIAIPKEIQLEVGKKVAYYEENDIRTGEFLCSSQTMKLSPMEIVNRMINTEEELKHFIKQNNVRAPADCHLYGLVIHVYNYLRSKIRDVSDEDSVMYDNVNGYAHDVLINSIKKRIKPSSIQRNQCHRSLNDEDFAFERAITPRSPPPVTVSTSSQSSSSVTVSVQQCVNPDASLSSPLSSNTIKIASNERKSTSESTSNSSLPSSPCAINAIIKNAPKRISSPINIKKKEIMITTPKNIMITPDHDHIVETISIDPKDDIKIEINDNDENNPNGTEEIFATDQDINNGQQISGFTMNLGPMNQALIQAQQNLLQQQYNISQGHSSSIYPSPSMVAPPPKRSSINSLVETTGKRPRLDQPTIEVSLDNLSAIGKKEALMLTKEQIEMMLRINAPEVTLVQHIVRRPDLEKYWTYIRKINVNGHQTVWTQCTKCGEVVQFKNFEVLNPTGQNRSKSGFRTKQIYSHFNSCNDSTSLSTSYPLTLSQLETSKIELLKKLCQLQKNTLQTGGLPGP